MDAVPTYNGDHHFKLDSTADVTIHHGATEDSLDVMSLVLPAEYELVVPPHFHPKRTEWMKVLEGEVVGIINGEKVVLKPDDPWREVPAKTRHSFIKVGGKAGKRTVWMERSRDPIGKKRFFEDFMGNGKFTGFVGAMAAFYRDGDTVPALPGGPWTDPIAYALLYIVGGIAHNTGLAKQTRYEEEQNMLDGGVLPAT